MLLNMYSIYDSVAQTYLTPFFMPRDAEAKRAFTNLVNDPSTAVSKSPADYTLFNVGWFETDNAMTNPEPSFVSLGNGINFIRKEA